MMVVKNDTILYENYFNGHDRDSLSQVFSVTKTFVSTLVGIAIGDGKMREDQPVSDYLPYYKHGKKAKITIHHLLNMTSGLHFCDFKTPGKLIKFYYTDDEEKMLRNAKVQYEPGTHFAYCSMNTEMLGMCLEKAVGMPLAQYMKEKIWKPLGMEHDAQIALTKPGGEARMYAGLAATVRDLAKLGRLFLNNGNWNGKQIIPADWVAACRQRNTTQGSSTSYTNCWWLDTYAGVKPAKDKDDFYAGGYRGQFIYVNPDDNTIIVRVGTKETGANWPKSISKLGMLPLNNARDIEHLANNVSGQYKTKDGKSVDILFADNKAFITDYNAMGKLELIKENNYSFINRKKKMKLIVRYQNDKVNGLILEAGTQSEYLTKI
jgi:CubicO group peptidase (beta-lactamase class C family)